MRLDVNKLRQAMDQQEISQTELARRAKLSRATIARLLGRGEPGVHAGTEAKLAAALGLSAGALDAESIPTAYLDCVARQHAALDFAGLGVLQAAPPVPMDRGYVPLEVASWGAGGGYPDPSKPIHRVVGSGGRPSGSCPLALALCRARRAFILGNPGSGTTTALRHLARRYATARNTDGLPWAEGLTPVFVRLADWAKLLRTQDDVGVLDAALRQAAVPNPCETLSWLKQQAAARKLLLLLDGLDEVPDPEEHALVVERIRSFVDAHRDTRLVISSRTAGFQPPSLGARFDLLEVQPLPIDSIRAFAAEWCALRHGHEANRPCADCDRRLEAVRHAIVDHPRIAALASNPMMLALLVLLHEAGAELPRRRWELYRKATEAFLLSWERKKRSAPAGAPDRALDVEDRELVWVLESVALEMQRRDWTLVPRWWLLEHVAAFLRDELDVPSHDAPAQADTLTRSLQERSGMLIERAPECFAFPHLAFQEHFAARAVLALDDPLEALRPWFYHPRWVEVVRLVCSQLDRRRAPRLLRMILDDPDPAGRSLHRGLLRVLACLADGAPVHDRTLIEELGNRVVQLGRSKWPGIAEEAVRWLGELRGTRLGPFATGTVDRLLKAAIGSAGAEAAFGIRMEAAMAGLVRPPDDLPPRSAHQEEDHRLTTMGKTTFGGRQIEVVLSVLPEAWDEDWTDAVVSQLLDEPSTAVRRVSALNLKPFAQRRKVRKALLSAFEREQDATVREAIAEALAPAATLSAVSSRLMRGLDYEPEAGVRGACAAALRSAAGRNAAIRDTLRRLVQSSEPGDVRAGAARGLVRCADQAPVQAVLLAALGDDQAPDDVRSACLGSLEGVLPSLPEALRDAVSLLAGEAGSRLTAAAAETLAQCAAQGRVPWAKLPIGEIEAALMGVKGPCPHAGGALRALVDARELRRLGVPREARIRRALSDLEERVRCVFIFGSSARGDQHAASDIDLMVIGGVSLRELAPALRRLEQELGSQVNAVIYSQEEWRKRCAQRDVFIANVLDQKKLFVVGDANELAAMAR